MSDVAPTPPPKNKGGRPKGSVNRAAKLLADAQAIIEQKFGIIGFHPVTSMLIIAADERIDVNLRLTAMSKAAPYLVPTLKAVELTGDNGGPVQTADVTEMAAQAARVFGISSNDALEAVGGAAEAAEDDEAEEAPDPERLARAAERRAQHEAEAEEAEVAREAAKRAKATRGRQAENLDDVDEEVFGSGSV